MKKIVRNALLLFVTFLSFSNLHATAAEKVENQYANVEITKTHVAGKVHMLQGAGGNIAVQVGDDGLVMVDDQFAPLSKKIQAAVDSFETGKVKFVLNTHWHGDHVGGNAHFGKDATIIAHSNVRERLSTDQFVAFFNKTVEAQPKAALPVITFDDSISIHFNDEEIRVLHLPMGHTDGDSVVFFKESNVVHMGDHFFNGRFPYIDLGAGGSVDGYIANVKTILSMIGDDVKIIPGHGPLATKTDLGAFHKTLTETVAIIRNAKKEGRDTSEIAAEELLAVWAEWGTGFISSEQWVAIVMSDN